MRHHAVRSSRRALTTGLVLALALGALASCSDKSDIGPGGVAKVRLVPDTLHVLLGRTDTARAFPLDQDNAFLPKSEVSWSTADQAIATVNDSGVVTGVALGTTELTGTSHGKSGTATIVVDPLPTMTFSPDTARLAGIAGSGTPAGGTDTVINAGGGAIPAIGIDSITYVSGSTGWLTASLSLPAAPAPVDLVANPSAVALGRHVALVWFNAPEATPATASMPVVLTTTADVPASVTRSAGQSQTATVNSAVAVAPAVLVRDQFNNPVAGISVTFAPAGGSGSVTGGTTTTNASGVATVGSWTLGTVAGGNTLNVTVTGIGGAPLTFSATGTPGAAANLAVSTGNNQAAIAGQAVTTPPAVVVTDQFGNAVTGTAVTFAVATGGGSITGPGTASNASGIAAVGSWTLGPTVGVNTLTATSGALNGSPVTFTATGNPGNATNMALVSGSGQSGTVNTALAAPFVVKVTDNNGNAVPGVTVGWAALVGGSMNPASSVTDASGLASSTRTLGTVAGAQSATGAVAGLIGSPVNFAATANPGAVTTLAVNAGNNQTATVNTILAAAPSVIARDAFTNVVPNAAVTFTVATGGGQVNCGSGATSACAVNTNGSGIATITGWQIGTVSGTNNNSLSVTRVGATGTTFVASGTPGAVASVTLNSTNAQVANRSSSVASAPSVIVRDAFSNLVPNATVSFSVIAGTAGNSTVNCTGVGTTSTCNVTANGSGVATVLSWAVGPITTPSAGAPSGGLYSNTLRAASNGVTLDFTASSVWSYNNDVLPLTASCLGCHITGLQSPFMDVVGFRASSRNVAIATGACTQGIFPFQTTYNLYINPATNGASTSLVFNKISSATPCIGGQMPQLGPFMTTDQVNIIRDWINNASPAN